MASLAIALAIGLLGILLTSLVYNGFPAFVQTKVDLEIYVDPAKVDAKDPAKGNYRVLVRDSLASLFPDVTNDKEKADLTKILTSDAALHSARLRGHPSRTRSASASRCASRSPIPSTSSTRA